AGIRRCRSHHNVHRLEKLRVGHDHRIIPRLGETNLPAPSELIFNDPPLAVAVRASEVLPRPVALLLLDLYVIDPEPVLTVADLAHVNQLLAAATECHADDQKRSAVSNHFGVLAFWRFDVLIRHRHTSHKWSLPVPARSFP